MDVVALGELLIDMTNNGKTENNNDLFEANPGGAPCNVLAMLKRFGHEVGFIGKVGNDIFGRKLKSTLEEVGIATNNLLMDPDVRTTLAFVETFPDGDRDFSFYRNPGADMMLRKDEVDAELIGRSRVFHFGTLSMTHEMPREATLYALEEAKKSGAIITFDPNLREPLWNSLDEAKEQILTGMKYCDYLKISDNEIQWFTGEEDFDKGIEILRKTYPNIRLICLSIGPEGSRAYCGEHFAEVAAFVNENTVETTGAGDTFCANVLDYVLGHGLDAL
ncbi:MAG: carbohydrate kinase, partial [Lachnospiraceae bacterium]|nr:carbohydrate kinase [Lachnospiraceae bacterium]